MIENEMRDLVISNVDSLVEMSCRDFNRSLAGLRRLSDSTGMAVIASTGFRNGATARAAGYDPSDGGVAELLESDIVQGEDGVSAGVIKCGSGRGDMTPDDVHVIQMAAKVQARTGAPLSTHTAHGLHAVRQLDILQDAGADLSHVAIGHLDLEPDIDVHLEVLRRNAYVIYDQIGKVKYIEIDDYATLLGRVFDAGFADRVLLSSDFGRRSYLVAYGGTPGLQYVASKFLTELKERGVNMSHLERTLTENPSQFFSCRRLSCKGTDAKVDENV
jgi:phosphotriesterase-related protein